MPMSAAFSETQNADPLAAARVPVVLATIFLNVVAVALLTLAPWSDWRTGLALNLLDNALLIAFSIRHRDGFLVRLMVFGLVVGIVELAADAWLVEWTRTLDYSVGGGPMLWRSPVWMPLAWEIVAVQFGFVGLRLWERFGAAGLAAIGALGAINIPYYEEMARRIHWWTYSGCRMVSGTPYYIIVGELLITVAFALLAKPVRRGGWTTALFAGIGGGAAIFAAYAVAFGITDRIVRG
jgi:hypothetical protein